MGPLAEGMPAGFFQPTLLDVPRSTPAQLPPTDASTPAQITELPAPLTRRPSRELFGSHKSTRSQEVKYEYASQLAVEETRGNITFYLPYLYELKKEEGKPDGTIASRYVKVMSPEGREVWFEILGGRDKEEIQDVDFLTHHQLHMILGDVNSSDTQKLQGYVNNPNPQRALIRLVGQDEHPLYTRDERSHNPQEIHAAAQQLIQAILPQGSDATSQISVADIETFLHEDQAFDPLFESDNGVRIGTPEVIHATLSNSHTREVIVYPAIGSNGEKTYIITDQLLPANGIPTESVEEVVGRTDFSCGCEKQGERSGHGCSLEFLGSLREAIPTAEERAEGKAEKRIIIVWAEGDAYGNGSVMHSIKRENMRALGLLPNSNDLQRQAVLEALQEVPGSDHRQLRNAAEVLVAAADAAGAKRIRLHTGKDPKYIAVSHEARNMYVNRSLAHPNQSHEQMTVIKDEHALRLVPIEIRLRDELDRARHARDRHALQPAAV